VEKLGSAVGARDLMDLYRRLLLAPEPAATLVMGDTSGTRDDGIWSDNGRSLSPLDQMMYHDFTGYLADDILVKLDRTSMSVGLEARVPLLDHRIVEFAWTLPLSLKIHAGEGKWILREMLRSYLPDHLVRRQKLGFDVEISDGLRGPLREWAEDLLDQRRLDQDGIFDPIVVRRLWREHLTGRHNRQRLLWAVLMFRAWSEHRVMTSGRIAAKAPASGNVKAHVDQQPDHEHAAEERKSHRFAEPQRQAAEQDR
jgi:asparagine synthase (glutamine-hydrolysing)